MHSLHKCGSLVVLLILAASTNQAKGQSFGIELHNTLMPASGGMAGVSVARPLDVQSALNGNPATLSQFPGTQFGFSGGWIEPTYNLSHTGGVLPNVGRFSGKSSAQGSALGNIGVTQDLESLGIPATFGLGLVSGAGAGLSWRDIQNSNGTTVLMNVLQIVSATSIDLTDELSIGGSLMLGSATLEAPFVGIAAAAYDYELRGSVGISYELGTFTSVGAYYQSRQNFNFDDAISFDLGAGAFSAVQDIDAGVPDNLGLGIAHDGLMNGRLLLAMDVLFKQWATADLFNALYRNQWVFQFGAQYAVNSRVRFRAGYAYAENPIDSTVGTSAGGVTPPVPAAAINYTQGPAGDHQPAPPHLRNWYSGPVARCRLRLPGRGDAQGFRTVRHADVDELTKLLGWRRIHVAIRSGQLPTSAGAKSLVVPAKLGAISSSRQA